MSDFRKYFPFFAKSDFIVFDNAGGSQVLKGVISKIEDYLLYSNVQIGASYEISEKSISRIKQGLEAMRELINAKSIKEIATGSSTTQLLFNLSYSIEHLFEAGDEFILTNIDHEANHGCWERLAKRKKINVREWKINTHTFQLELDTLSKLLNSRTKLVCFTHCSNVLGTIMPVKQIVQMVKRISPQCFIVVDGVAYMPHRIIDVQDLGVDFYVWSCYKTYGPHISVLYGKEENFLRLKSINHFFIKEDDIPLKLIPGNVQYETTYSLTAILEYYKEIGKQINPENPLLGASKLMQTKEEILSQTLITYLRGKPNITIIGSREYDSNIRVPTISFVIQGVDSEEVAKYMDKFNIGCRFGHFYAFRLMNALEIGEHGKKAASLGGNGKGVIRVSMVHYNTVEEVKLFIKHLDEFLQLSQRSKY